MKYINRAFKELGEKDRIIYILHLSGTTYDEIQRFGKLSRKFISRAIKRGCELYGIARETKYPISREVDNE